MCRWWSTTWTQSLFGDQKWTRSRRWTTSQNSCLGSWNATLTDIHTGGLSSDSKSILFYVSWGSFFAGLGSQTQGTSSWLLRCIVGQKEMKNHWFPIMNSSGDNYLSNVLPSLHHMHLLYCMKMENNLFSALDHCCPLKAKMRIWWFLIREEMRFKAAFISWEYRRLCGQHISWKEYNTALVK